MTVGCRRQPKIRHAVKLSRGNWLRISENGCMVRGKKFSPLADDYRVRLILLELEWMLIKIPHIWFWYPFGKTNSTVKVIHISEGADNFCHYLRTSINLSGGEQGGKMCAILTE